ncbi:MAG: hypothetical protein Kow00129_02500 [Thermoleophilia bacterium]
MFAPRPGRRSLLALAGALTVVSGLAAAAFIFVGASGGPEGQGAETTTTAPFNKTFSTGKTVSSTSSTTVSAGESQTPPQLISAPRFEALNWAGRPAGSGVAVYNGFPPEGKVVRRLPATGQFGEETVVRILRETVDRRGNRWYQALLPLKPNETKGWIRAEELVVFAREHRIVIDLSDHRLDLFKGEELVDSFPVAVGKSGTPTPTGEFFVTVRVRPPNPAGAYGPLALGLSAYSEVLTDWPGGGQAAIHGTNNPSAIGTDASHGCVRMRNQDILRVGEVAFVGTPVQIVP